MRPSLVALSLLLIISIACARTSQRVTPRFGDSNHSISVDGRVRDYVVHLPPAIENTSALPLVVVLHGGGGNATHAAKMTGLSQAADKAGAIVVYPNGTGQLGDALLTWNAGNCCGNALDTQVDDVNFIRTLIHQLQTDYPIDPKRIYATGISNGGMMSYRLACELADLFAAIAPVSGALNIVCNPSQPVALIAFHGTADQHVLYNGGAPLTTIDSHARVDQSVASAIAVFVQRDHCALQPQHQTSGNILHDQYANCANGTGVELYTIQGGSHAWPGGFERFLNLGDPPTQEISATSLMLDFFARHPKP